MKTNCFPKHFGGQGLFLFSFLLTLFNISSVWSQTEPASPYFYLPGGAEVAETFPLLQTEANVNIAGVIADVQITQQYQNNGDRPIEAIYLFPASTNAAVYAMQMTVGDRVIEAEIQEKNKARATYQKAKSAGKSASLLEQQRPNVFQMKVANILPGDTIKVVLSYTELLVPEEGLYEFIYPTVVGPRYAGETPTAQLVANHWVSNPYLEEGSMPTYSFDFELCLRAGIPVKEVQSPSHQVDIQFAAKEEVRISLSDQEKYRGNKDFILQYRLKGEAIESGLLLHEGKDENFFLMMMQPPKRPKLSEVPGREYIFLVDVSGSMSGFPLDISKKLLRELIGKLRPSDRFNVLLFAGSASFLSEQPVVATPEHIQQALNIIDMQRGGGGTNMLQAVKKAMALDKQEGVSRSFVILTDGYVNVEASLFDYIQYHLGTANFFAFGIGTSVNRHLIEGIAHVGFSDPFVTTEPAEALGMATQFRKYIQTPVLTNINLDFHGMEVYDVTPRQVPDLMGERPVVVFGKYKKSTASGKKELVLSGQTGEKVFLQKMDVSKIQAIPENAALQYLWARHRIKMLGDYTKVNYRGDQDLVGEITGLGLKYNLLTAYTSFVAVDTKVRNERGEIKAVKQPLPLPEGVPNSAVGRAHTQYNAHSSASTHSSSEEAVEFSDQSIMESMEIEPPRSGVPPPPPPPPEPEVEEIFKVVEEQPSFPGCEHLESVSERLTCSNAKLQEFIYQHLQYPAIARENGVEGTVVVQFVVDKSGKIKNIRLVRDIGAECGQEALRLVRLMVEKGLVWQPGKQRGRPVDVQYDLPVRFKLD